MVFGKHFVKYYLKYALLFLLGIGVLVVINYFQLEIPKHLGSIIGRLDLFDIGETAIDADPNQTIIDVRNIVKIIGKIVLVVAAGRVLWRLLIFGTSRRIEYDLRNEMFVHATKLSQDFYSHEKVGGMMTYFINDLSAIRMAYGPGILTLVDGLFLGGLAIRRMFGLNTTMTIIAVVPMVFMVIAMYFINTSMRKQFRIRQEKFRDLSDYTQENFSGISVIKAYVREAATALTFRRKSDELFDFNLRYVRRSTWSQIITSIAINMVIISIIAYGGVLIIKGGFTTQELVEYNGYFISLLWPTRALARFLVISSQAQASARRVSEFLDSEIMVKDDANVIQVNNVAPSIEIKGLDFAYPDDEEIILKDINFKIEAGEMVGILGRTGSGKTTIVDLLLRVYNVGEDNIFLGGYDIMKLPLKQVRDLVGYVPQDNFLFSDTISKNIGFAYDDLTDDQVVEAAIQSDIYSNIIDFKEGFNTMLGERGVTVSGGQKQRLSIARAIAKNPDILILDDSVSAVDTKTEETIINNLYNLRDGKTTIFIAHRISTVKNMDKIILIDDGKISAVGTHDELMISSTLYQDMVQRQELDEEENLDRGGEINNAKWWKF